MKHTNRITFWICAAVAALAFGCGAPEQKMGTSHEGIPIACTEPGESEAGVSKERGYDPSGCTRTERMWNVTVDAIPTPDEDGSDLGTAEQGIIVGSGSSAAAPITVDGFGTLTGFIGGGCPVDPTWTTARPLIGNCIIPEVVDTLNWAVCPSCFSQTELLYYQARMREAWDVWKASPQSTVCSGTTYTNHLPATAVSENKLFGSDANQNYDSARYAVYPVDSLNATARMGVDKDFIYARTPIRYGIRYWSWQYAAIQFSRTTMSAKVDRCIDITDPQWSLKVMRAWRWVFAHELGHSFGMPHRNVGLMRPSSLIACSDLFSAAVTAPAINAPDTAERLITNLMKSSSGFDAPLVADVTGCGTSGSAVSGVPDDEAVVNF